ncbi:serine hydrolase domain-containing protein [Deinococcus sp.]|uniref:serine hydrolase domain-containing protein n=1 Tax=Deinococcus sp. TaxID=47478 RepID=UPI003C7D4389
MPSPLPESTPEAQGVSSQAILNFLKRAEAAGLELHGFRLLRRGRTLAAGAWAPYTLDLPHPLYSVSKSFVASAVGLLIGDGRLTLDDPVLPFFPEYAPAVVSERLAALRVRDLLTMTSGHAEDQIFRLYDQQPQPWARSFLAQPLDHAPGERFVYNSAATYMLSAILERVSGQPLLDFLSARLLEPLGIQGAAWQLNAEGQAIGGWGLRLPLDGLARLGQLYLQGGEWEGRQLLPRGWVEQASAAQVSTAADRTGDWAQGYGFQLWRSTHAAYRADGALGQFIMVLPEQEAVLALTAGVNDMQAVLDAVWAELLPAFAAQPLPPDAPALARLRAHCAALALPTVAGQSSSSSPGWTAGRRYTLAANPLGLNAVQVSASEQGLTLTLHTARGPFSLEAGLGGWLNRTSGWNPSGDLDGPGPWQVAGSAAWTTPGTLELHFKYLGTAATHVLQLQLPEGGERLQLELSAPVSFWGHAPLSLEGTAEG